MLKSAIPRQKSYLHDIIGLTMNDYEFLNDVESWNLIQGQANTERIIEEINAKVLLKKEEICKKLIYNLRFKELPKNSDILFHDESFAGAEKGKDLVFKWFDKEQILSENIAPNFMINDIDGCHKNKKYMRTMRRK